MKDQVDYSLYLVTDSTEEILGKKDLVDVVEQALLGGVTVVQYRDKTSSASDLIATAKRLHEKCKSYSIPFLINDRLDIALAINAEGVHLGQDDTPVSTARQILGPDKIIGATVSNVDEARIAVEQGADYLGIGTLYATTTKKNTKEIIGINGIRRILYYLANSSKAAWKTKTVCIGGINASNIARIFYQLHLPPSPKTIDGMALVSAIIAAPDPQAAASGLRKQLTSPPPWDSLSSAPHFWLDDNAQEIDHVLVEAIAATKAVKNTTPLSHNMTNLVVQNFAANVALSIGASPIMANYGEEASDLAALGGGLVVNMGTVTPDGLLNYTKAITAYNTAGGPIVLDPVGAGATSVRRSALSSIMGTGYFDLIKGNEREILAVARASGFTVSDASQQRGVDSGSSLFTLAQRANIVFQIAARERNVILMTGAIDVISDGNRTYAISNGHEYLGRITGSGCTLGTTLSAYLAASPGDKLLAAVAGILHYEIAAEKAAEREDVKGPGTFVPAFIDELYHYGVAVAEGRENLAGTAKVECLKDAGTEGVGVLDLE